MRTTLTLDKDVAEQAKKLVARSGKPFKQLVNEALRLGFRQIQQAPKPKPYRTKPHNMGPAKIDLDNIAEAIEQIEGPFWR
jgi:hypothetical protein